MPDDSIDDGLDATVVTANTQGNSTKLIDSLEKVSDQLKAEASAGAKDELSTILCPYCKGEAYRHASHCKNCGKDLVQFLAVMSRLNEAQKQCAAKLDAAAASTPPENDPADAVPHPPSSFLTTLQAFVLAAAMPSLLFVAMSYLALWGTRLKTSEWGPVALVIGVFLLCLSVGATHVRSYMGEQASKWRLMLWGTVLGVWIAVLQTALQYVLDKHFPIEREEFFELLNTVLGVLFAYVSGSAIPVAQRLLGNTKLGVGGLIEVLWRIRFSLISGALSLLIGFLK